MWDAGLACPLFVALSIEMRPAVVSPADSTWHVYFEYNVHVLPVQSPCTRSTKPMYSVRPIPLSPTPMPTSAAEGQDLRWQKIFVEKTKNAREIFSEKGK